MELMKMIYHVHDKIIIMDEEFKKRFTTVEETADKTNEKFNKELATYVDRMNSFNQQSSNEISYLTSLAERSKGKLEIIED